MQYQAQGNWSLNWSIMSTASPRPSNRLLASLPRSAVSRLRPHLELVPVGLGQVLHQQRVPFEDVFFPTSAVVTLVIALKGGASGERGMIGNEGMVGTPLLLGADDADHQAVVQVAGEAYRLKFAPLKTECERSPKVLHLLLRYVRVLYVQTGQAVVCNRYHSIEQQLSRWLLLTLDRVPSNEIHLTHEMIAKMLGVGRAGVTTAAVKLQNAGLIQYHRGTITVLDRRGLKARSCECYKKVRREIDRLVPMPAEQRGRR